MYGSSTIGVKKSTVCTSAGPPSHLYTPASSAVLKSTRTRGSVCGWYVAQHLSELASGEFARSTGAGDDLGQTLVTSFLLSCVIGACRAASLRSMKRLRALDPR